MVWHDFRWQGKLASSMGVIVTKQVGYIRPEEVINTVQIQGRAGTLVPLGQRSFSEVVYAPECTIEPNADIEAIRSWLVGDGAVVFGSMPNYAFDARLANQFEMLPLFDNEDSDYITFTPIFTCQPFRYPALQPEPAAIGPTDTQPITLTNRGNIYSQPIIHITGLTGDIQLAVNGTVIELTDVIEKTGDLVIDSELMDVYSEDLKILLNNYMSGEFPTLAAGENLLTWEMITEGATFEKITVNLNERWI